MNRVFHNVMLSDPSKLDAADRFHSSSRIARYSRLSHTTLLSFRENGGKTIFRVASLNELVQKFAVWRQNTTEYHTTLDSTAITALRPTWSGYCDAHNYLRLIILQEGSRRKTNKWKVIFSRSSEKPCSEQIELQWTAR